MKHPHLAAAFLFAAWSALSACGDPLVGGRCATGYVADPDGTGCIRAGGPSVRDGAGSFDGAMDADGSGNEAGFLDGPSGGDDTTIRRDGATDDGRSNGDGGMADGTGQTDGNVGPDGSSLDGSTGSDGSASDGSTGSDGASNVDGNVGPDGSSLDGSTGADGSILDGSTGSDGSTRDAAIGDALVCLPPSIACNGACIDPATDRDNCGTCSHQCASTERCVSGRCALQCDAPLVACNGACVDLQTDPLNCGSCGNVCPSGICSAGRCRGAQAGHVVLIGHSFEGGVLRDPNRILTNALFLRSFTSRPTRILVYRGSSAPASDLNVNAALATSGRTYALTYLADSTTMSSRLSIDSFEAVLVYQQRGSSDAQIDALATDFQPALVSFARSGGVVVVLDGYAPSFNHGTYPIVNAPGLLDVTGSANAGRQDVDTLNYADALAAGVSTPYRAGVTSVTFTAAGSYAVFGVGGQPLALHRAIAP